ncbi:chemotaxis response regulator protein-glutamate methylesterase [Geobacter hydrogenophilus]|uniref:Protein-glutamate methylesterase/protein-glutamine glutaminase n=1 Tax=Geobacter hydrogenophilus TaxID=40983 RepID=A0A9W6G358_9BACT|nr:chemotaxis response regulator protein-glutamate methylesterase [Geobacter hydrogenophilus]MBT0892258.1 chemotaxis response regulator protein-glutamate methylesterase [Geobacter hydrogenophilus]GLI39651.1 chemotaxis response regulator protein-glutamate methylesterase of group 3 operon [Geobacter hydrogenophilus]
MRKIRVVVIDDSAFNRRAIIKMLESMPEVVVAGYANDGEEGIRKVIDLKPDLVTLDLEMPKMDGFTLLRIIMGYCPTPVIVISAKSDDEKVFKALELGAVDFVAKPSQGISEELLTITGDIQQKVRGVFSLNMKEIIRREKMEVLAPPPIARKKAQAEPRRVVPCRLDVVAIGSSTGGPPAIQRILSSFREALPLAIVISQHMPAGFTRTFAERLNRLSVFEVKEAADGDTVWPGRVLIAPGGHNMVFEKSSGSVVVRVRKPSPEDRYIPSVDAMLASCADAFGPRTLGVVLTGMGNDGSRGVRAVKGAGGQVLAEAESSAVVFGMPREAIATGVVDKVIPLDLIAREIRMRCGVATDLD